MGSIYLYWAKQLANFQTLPSQRCAQPWNGELVDRIVLVGSWNYNNLVHLVLLKRAGSRSRFYLLSTVLFTPGRNIAIFIASGTWTAFSTILSFVQQHAFFPYLLSTADCTACTIVALQ